MNATQSPRRQRQSGLVLVSSMLLLLIITILAVSMFRSFGVQERIAGNLRDKQRATHAAEAAEQWAEWWLSNPTSSVLPVVCAAPVLSANLNEVQACSNAFPAALDANSVTALPWKINGAPVGITYTPPGMNVGDETQADEYAQPPTFYISYLGACKDNPSTSTCYQIDAVGYGGGAGTAVSVVESTYEVTSGVSNLGGL